MILRLFTGLSQCDKPGRRPGPARAGRSSRPLVAVPAGGGTVCNVVRHPASHGQSRPLWLTRSAPGPARRASAGPGYHDPGLNVVGVCDARVKKICLQGQQRIIELL